MSYPVKCEKTLLSLVLACPIPISPLAATLFSGSDDRMTGKPFSIEAREAEPYAELEREAVEAIRFHLKERPRALKMWELLSGDPEVVSMWSMANFVAVKKLGMNDHGQIHAEVATASALTMLDLLIDSGIEPDIVMTGYGDADDAALVVLTATLCHDFGNQVHREAHYIVSIDIVIPVLDRLLPVVYDDIEKMTRIRAFILSAIYSHHGEPPPLTIEAALVCIGDSTDMTKGRGREAFESGSITIHSVSALAIEKVEITEGRRRPIELRVSMSNSAGIFQVQEILGPKVRAGPLADYVDVVAVTMNGEEKYEKRIVDGIAMEGRRFVPFHGPW